MSGLTMLSEEEALDQKPQVVTNFSISPLRPVPAPGMPTPETPAISSFLKNCKLCRKRLMEGRDVYMYRGRAFCTVECRSRQINMDEHGDRVRQWSAAAMVEEGQLFRRRHG